MRKNVMRLSVWILVGALAATTAACSKPPPAPTPPAQTVKDIMDKVVDPSGDFIFESIQEISDKTGTREEAPKTDADWAEVRRHLTILHDAPTLLTAEGIKAARPTDRSKNPAVENEPEEIQKLLDADRSGFARHAGRLREAATVGLQAVDAKDKNALFTAISGIDRACESCHLRYWYPKDARAHQAAKEEGVTD